MKLQRENRTLRVYPNPISRGNELQVEVPSVMGFEQLLLISPNGQVLQTINSFGKETIKVSMKSYPTGIYFIYLQGKEKNKYYKIVVLD